VGQYARIFSPVKIISSEAMLSNPGEMLLIISAVSRDARVFSLLTRDLHYLTKRQRFEVSMKSRTDGLSAKALST
jgi:hypothetical protein